MRTWCGAIIVGMLLCACAEQKTASATVEEVTTVTEACVGDCVRGWFSPDGALIAYTGAKYRGLFLYSLGDRTRKIVSSAESAGFFPVWSPDGSRIAFRERIATPAGDRFRVVTVSRDGASRRVEADGLEEEMPLFWNDALRAVSRTTLRPTLFHDTGIVGRSSLPFAVSTEDGVKVLADGGKVTVFPMGSHSPRFSPDGRMIAYLSGNAVRIYDLRSGDDRKLVDGSQPAWMPDSKSLLIAVTEDDGRDITASRLYLVSLDGTTRPIRTAPGAIPLYPDAAGKRILYTDHASDRILVHTLEME